MDQLIEIRTKFNWAKRHQRRWFALYNRWLDGKPYGIRGEPEQDGWFVVRLVVVKPPPPELALVFADLVHNLRSVLDHVVCQLVEINGGLCKRETGFPVVLDEKDWGAQAGGRLRNFPKDFVRTVRDVQPFTYGDRAKQHPLHILHRLDIDSKHERLVPLVVSQFEWMPTFQFNRDVRKGESLLNRFPTAPFDLANGGELVRVRGVSKGDDLRVVKLLTVEELAIGHGPPYSVDRPFGGQMGNMLVFVGTVIDALAPAFPTSYRNEPPC